MFKVRGKVIFTPDIVLYKIRKRYTATFYEFGSVLIESYRNGGRVL